ncbi:MAG TPA: TIGR00725 family protein [Acidimicrobiales bacterium]|nr:TIGR00725 family protein [Acidimicrobiales bacterium]
MAPSLPAAPYVAVVGAAMASDDEVAEAFEVGRRLGAAGAVVVCGGLGGVMAAACRGAKDAGGTTVGILPGDDRAAANDFVDVAIATGLGEARNVLVVRAADALVAIGGEHGTLSEIAFALKIGRPVVGLGTWPIDGITAVGGPSEAARAALDLAAT